MLQYKVVTRKNPRTKESKFYATLTNVQPVSKSKIIERIEKKCTLSSSDVKAVVDALEVEIIDCLQDGLSVRLGDLGSFRPVIHSKASDSAELVTVANITRARAVFTPSTKMRSALLLSHPNMKFTRWTPADEAPIGGTERSVSLRMCSNDAQGAENERVTEKSRKSGRKTKCYIAILLCYIRGRKWGCRGRGMLHRWT